MNLKKNNNLIRKGGARTPFLAQLNISVHSSWAKKKGGADAHSPYKGAELGGSLRDRGGAPQIHN